MFGIISQDSHHVAFWSRKFSIGECNYDIYDQELLAIVSPFQHWCHYVEGTIMIYTDYKNLEIFITTKILNRCQICWAELLAGYKFVITAIPGKTNPANRLSWRPDYAVDILQPSGTILPSSAVNHMLSTALAIFTPPLDLHQQITTALSHDPAVLLHLQNPPKTVVYVTKWPPPLK